MLIDAFVEIVTPELPLRETATLEEYVTVHMRQFARVVSGRNGRLLAAVIAAAQNDPAVEARLPLPLDHAAPRHLTQSPAEIQK